jgi:FAD/FMN-containing dehydrogenase
MMSIADELKLIAKGEILSDEWNREVYSVDASHYSIEPSVILFPLDEHDLAEICRYGYSKNASITARGAGTGLLGQSLNDNIIIDFTKHMNKILEFESDHVIVQPGIVKGVLDKELKKKGKFRPPDPASSNYCTIGGMIANNSSGVHTLGYGSTIDYLDTINVVYSDGNLRTIGDSSNTNTNTNIKYGKSYPDDDNDDKIMKLYRLLSLRGNIELIENKYPNVTKNSCGYRLDKVIKNEKFYAHKLFAASEGTLGLVTSAKLRIIDIPLYRTTIVLGFIDLLSAMRAVPFILKFSPVALEMMDETVLQNIRESACKVTNKGDMHRGNGCLLYVEFSGDNLMEVEQKFVDCKEKLSSMSSLIESVSDEQSSVRIWRARKNALNNITKLTVGSRKPLGLIEDTVVSPNVLCDYAQFILQKYIENNLDYVIYGHAGNGNLHTRPMINTESQNEIKLYDHLAEEVFTKAISYGGTITGEHGDGIARTKYIEFMYGSQIVSIFQQIKKIFDPKFIMNPGKKVISRI